MNRWILAAILFLAIFLRTYKLSTVPPSPSLDEVSIGYNAYSILQTGKDEYGTPFPVLLRAYDDWRPAGYVYVVIPFIELLGVNSFSVRLPSVIFSVASVFLTYFLVVELFKKKSIALCASLLLAISPWHIYLTRLGHEVNLGLFLDILGAYGFLRAINRKQGIWLIISAICFALTLYSYQSQKIVAPVVVLGLILIYRPLLLQTKNSLTVAALIGFCISIPMVRLSATPEGLTRLRATSAFSEDHPAYQKFSNRRVASAQIFFSNYISHFDPQWLFFGSNRENHKVPKLGLLYWWELPLILMGLISLFKRLRDPSMRFVLLWLLTASLPGAMTSQAPHAMRAFSSLPYWYIVSALGVLFLYEFLKKRYVWLFLSTGFVVIVISAGFFAKQYFDVFPREQSDSFQFALTQAVLYADKEKSNYERIVFSNQNHLYQSYMFYLFHSRYNPNRYLQGGGTKSGGFAESHFLDIFEFRPITWNKDSKLKNTLLIGNITDFPADMFTIEQFRYLDGTVGVVAVKL